MKALFTCAVCTLAINAQANATQLTTEQPWSQGFIGEKQVTYRYKGYLDVRVIEPQGAQYILGVKFLSGYAKPVDYTLRHYNGKAAIETFKPFYRQSNGDDIRLINITHKYYYSMRIREDDDKRFSARVKLFKRRDDIKLDINKPYKFAHDDFEQLQDQPVKGEFNQDNEYLFVDAAEVKFYIKLNFDLIFTKEEIMERFNKGQNKP